jgi:hypothetical protein
MQPHGMQGIGMSPDSDGVRAKIAHGDSRRTGPSLLKTHGGVNCRPDTAAQDGRTLVYPRDCSPGVTLICTDNPVIETHLFIVAEDDGETAAARLKPP